MILFAIGILIGAIMGLTGAGGALISIPLFMQYLKMPLKDASVYSLTAVVFASLFNFIFQRKSAKLSLSLKFVIFSAIGSFFARPFKTLISDNVIALLLTLIALYSLFSVWKKNKSNRAKDINSNTVPVAKTVIAGMLLGILTTFTGLGGGVLMLPVLMGIFHLTSKEAVATSLLVVGCSSLISFLIQIYYGATFKLDIYFAQMLAGIFVMSFLLKLLMKKISPQTSELLRKGVFTAVVIYSLYQIYGHQR